MHVVTLAVQLDQLGLEVGADLGEDSSECFDSLAIKAALAFGDKDQMNVHCRSAVSAVSKVLDFVHGPDNNESMERRQAFRFQLMPNGEQQRQMRRFAGCARYVYNKALALKKERYEKKEQLTRFQLDKLLVQWKQETPWLREAPAHALQQAILDLDKAYTNFFEKRAKFPKFHKKGVRDSFRESDQKCIKLEQGNNRIQLPKIGWVRYRSRRDSQRHRQPVGWPVVRQRQHVRASRATTTRLHGSGGDRLGGSPVHHAVGRPTRRPVVPTQEFLAQAQAVAAAVGTQAKVFE